VSGHHWHPSFALVQTAGGPRYRFEGDRCAACDRLTKLSPHRRERLSDCPGKPVTKAAETAVMRRAGE
jgi:hypothetical protein